MPLLYTSITLPSLKNKLSTRFVLFQRKYFLMKCNALRRGPCPGSMLSTMSTSTLIATLTECVFVHNVHIPYKSCAEFHSNISLPKFLFLVGTTLYSPYLAVPSRQNLIYLLFQSNNA